MKERLERETFTVGQILRCINAKPLPGNTIGPKLEERKEDYVVKEIFVDAEGNQHLDVGLKSELLWVTSYETGETLPRSKEIHWCHPSRFKLTEKKEESENS